MATTTHTSLSGFATHWQREVMLGIDHAIRVTSQNICREVVIAVISDTPVDTGQARSNWLASLGSPRSGTRATLGRSPAGPIGEAQAVISFFKNGDTFYLTNNLDYIEDLDAGKSPQAGPGYIARAIQRGAQRGVRLGFTINV